MHVYGANIELIATLIIKICLNKFLCTYTGQYPPPNTLHISAANFISKELTFTWSSVAPDCPTIHYNILASNCGSCPTTTNHTNVACIDVSTNGSNCTLAVQTVACRNITGNISEPISIIFYPTKAYSDATESVGTHNLDCNLRAHTASIGFLATALIISVVVSIIGITIVLTKSKIIAIFGRSNSEDEGSTHVHVHAESSYEEVAVPSPSVRLSIISTQDNIAYGLTNT